jgi:hypothetical protein
MSKIRYNKLSGLFVLLFSASFFSLSAQDTSSTIGHVSIASPTAASLGKYGDIPVSYNTGIPNISIPIYTVKSGGLSLPISLSYHAGGLKVQEQASWVGAGWSLNAGGVITRTVVGGPDDRGVQATNICYDGFYSDYGYNSYAFIPKLGATGTTFDGYWADDITFCQGYKDAEPDLYFFNFGGYSGKFYFNDDRTPMFVPEEDFKVVPDLNNGVGGFGFQGFTVTTPDGVRYYFGMTGNDNTGTNPLEITFASTIANGPANANAAVSSWYLNKIVSADGMDSINLTYVGESYGFYALSMFPITNLASSSGLIGPTSNYSGFSLVKNFVNGVRLSTITFPNGTVTFNKAPTARTDLSGGYPANSGLYDATNTNSYALGNIIIANSSGFCKKDSLYTSYFHDNINTLNGQLAADGALNILSDTYRLRLDSLQEYSCDATAKIPPHKFTYYSELVPRKLSFGVDHWGFYNGVTGNQSLIPTYSLVTNTSAIVKTLPGANRDAGWPAMRGGALQQITYPTGGFTQFTYQPNDTYVTATNYVNTYRTAMSCGWDGHNGSLGDGGDNPDSSHIHLTGNTFQFILQNSTGGGSGTLEIFDATTNSLVSNVGTATAGQTDTFYVALPVGNYWMELFKSPATSGNGISATINENVPVVTNGNDTVGGLRIQTITHNDGLTANNIVTNYTYTVGGTQSSGILYSRPIYVQPIRNDMYGWIYQPITGTPGCITTAGTYYLGPSSISPMSTMQGNHIGYNEVDVTQTGNGHSVYRYYGSDYWDNIIGDVCTRTINTTTCSTSIPNFPAPPLAFDPMRGELKYEGHFNQAGKILKDVTYTPSYATDPMVTPAMSFIDMPSLYSATGYVLQTAKKVQTTEVQAIYDPTTSTALATTTTVYYGSNFHHQATRKVSSTSTGDSLATNTKYVFDFRVSACDAIPDSLTYYINSVNADTSLFFGVSGITLCSAPDWICRTDTLANMRRRIALSRIKFINYRLRYYSGAHDFQDSCYAATEASADTLLKPVLRLKDEFQNVAIETSEWKDLNLRHANFTKYDTSLSPVGFAYPGRTQLVNLQAVSGSFTNAAISGNTIAVDGRYQNESFYKFSSGDPQQVISRDGLPNSYLWDYKNSEPIAKIVNATIDQIAYTSFEADGSGSWTIGSATRDATTSITGSQSYNLTNGSCSRTGLTSGSTYIVSYWSKTGSSFTVTGSTATKQGKTISINGGTWTYFEHTVTGTTSVTVSGTGDIDELRLYPSNAQMTTYTYTPLVGMTASCDVDNRVSYFYYDALGRLRYVKDQDGNIIKTTEYHYMGQ